MAAPDVDARPALARATGTGPFFAVEPWTAGAGWRPVSAFVDGSAALADRVSAAATVLARAARTEPDTLDRRAVASVVSLGLLARLVSPPLAAVTLGGVLPHWDLGSLWWRPTGAGPWPLALRVTEGREVGDVADPHVRRLAVDLVASAVVEDVVRPVVRRVHEDFSLSEKVLWGNVASALGGATDRLVAAHPARADASVHLVRDLLDRGPLAGTTWPDAAAGALGAAGRRRSCCLFYRVPGSGCCADCVLGLRGA